MMNESGHLLSLKVMRVSRPTLASAWQPFYSSSPSLSAHSTASILSLQGTTPLPGHPKTLRDLTHASELLTLPAAFGAIQLGESFSSSIAINNHANSDVPHVHLKVEMQTATTKSVLLDLGGPDNVLRVGQTMQNIVTHEMKELGQHVLACTVSYHTTAADLQSFRKFYKFAVTNPLSVKTKVHIPKSPSALLSPAHRENIFLEVHIQNLTSEPMWFEHVRLQCADDWQLHHPQSANPRDGRNAGLQPESKDELDEEDIVFAGIMHPQDTRQYVYILSPTPESLRARASAFPAVYLPGTVIPLGRLDISWRSSFGEPGRLLTSMLSRRIPLSSGPPASALPPHLQRATSTTTPPPRPQSPQLPQRSGTPPYPARPATPQQRPATPPISPYKPRTGSVPRPQSPTPSITSNMTLTNLPLAASAAASSVRDIDVDLVVRKIPRGPIALEQPFSIAFTLTTSASPPSQPLPTTPTPSAPNVYPSTAKRRILRLAVQHMQPTRRRPAVIQPQPHAQESFSPRLPSSASGFSTPSSTVAPHRAAFSGTGLAEKLQSISLGSSQGVRADDGETAAKGWLPAPFAEQGDSAATGIGRSKLGASRAVLFLGTSITYLDPIEISLPSPEDSADGEEASDGSGRVEVAREFEVSYMPLRKGFAAVGGLRVLLVRDCEVADGETDEEDDQGEEFGPVRVLKEFDVVGEIWVKT